MGGSGERGLQSAEVGANLKSTEKLSPLRLHCEKDTYDIEADL